MARAVNNKKDFKIIVMTPKEAIDKCGFGYYDEETNETLLIDDNTNTVLNDEDYVYYVCVLNRLFSKSVVRRWLKEATRYSEDIPYELRYFDAYMELLNR